MRKLSIGAKVSLVALVLGLSVGYQIPTVYGVVCAVASKLTPFSTAFNGVVGLDYHEPSGQLIASVNAPTGSSNNLDLIASSGAHTAFGTLSGLTGDVPIASVRNGACLSVTSPPRLATRRAPTRTTTRPRA